MAAAAALASCNSSAGSVPSPQKPALADLANPVEVSSVNGIAHVTLSAVTNTANGLPQFSYQGQVGIAPTIRVKPGDTIVVDYTNKLSGAGDPMSQMSNLHFHGMRVSPVAPSDDVMGMMAMPGQTLHYVIQVPANHEPGLYYYHPHAHGNTHLQVGYGGMSGAIVVEGLQQHIPALAQMRERILVARDTNGGNNITINGLVQPNMTIAKGEQQFVRLVNSTSWRYIDVSVPGSNITLVARDGVALDALAGNPATMVTSHILIPPAGRAEFVITGTGSPQQLKTAAFDSGPVGDPDADQVLANLVPPSDSNTATSQAKPMALRVGAALPHNVLSLPLPPPAAQRTIVLTQDDNGFYIGGKAFDPSDPPQIVAHLGTVEEWTVVNTTDEVHAFHMHQVHFVVENTNGVLEQHPAWLDMANVPNRTKNPDGTYQPGYIKILADFRDPVIAGTFMFHCHILEHEDHGMMAKITVQ